MQIISKIQIKHFRSLFESNIDVCGDFNIFAGANDSGKSNILKALNLFFNNQTSFLDWFNFADDYSKLSLLKAREKKKGRQFITIRLHINIDSIDGKEGLKKLVKQNDEDLWVERTWWKYEDQYRQRLPEYLEKADQGLKRSFSVFLSSIQFVYIPAFKNESVFAHVLRLAGDTEGVFLNADAKNLLNTTIADATKEISNDFSRLTNIETKISLPITLESFWSALTVASLFGRAGENTLSRGREEDYYINFPLRGEGIKSIFVPVILGWLAGNVKNKYWIWGIDEPENSLEATRALNVFSKFVDYSSVAQIFVSSHSPIFIFPKDQYSKTCNTKVYLARQNSEGDTRLRLINDGIGTEVNENNIFDEITTEFGVDYVSFLQLQKKYADEIQSRDGQIRELEEKIINLTKPVIFVEGEIDERYLKMALDVFERKDFPADIRNIGYKDESGNYRFSGKDSLDKASQLYRAQPPTAKVVLLFDIDCKKKISTSQNLVVYCPKNVPKARYITGIEHLLNVPGGFDTNSQIYTIEKKEGDVTKKMPNKDAVCKYVANLSADKQKEWLSTIITILEEIEKKYL